MPINTAAWVKVRGAQLEVDAAPYTQPREGEVVVRNKAVAVNPLDWVIQIAGHLTFRWIKYPFVLGSDLAGEVVEVGDGVTRFKVGDRVLAHAVGSDKDRNAAAEGAFQSYSVVLAKMAAPIPDTMSYEEAAVVPLATSTAACGLFQRDQLALEYPSASPKSHSIGETLLVWGGSTSVGSSAIQLAVAAGYQVITTCSPRNFDYVAMLGAALAFDYHNASVINDIVEAFRDKQLAGALAVGTGSAERCLEVVRACRGNKFISTASAAVSLDSLASTGSRSGRAIPLVSRMVSSTVAFQVARRRRGVGSKFIFGTTLKANEVGEMIYEAFLPTALATGRFVPAPRPVVVGHGLRSLQAAMETQRKGVSAAKVVVSL